ncbi:MAG: polymer-forming cytoskeletal protein [Bacteroidia bacterium]|nr:polymer-forming cytoskeletal protein [Bacteroidia bacterium]MDW8301551.1 polymer-forming cytoskeletal protein [Bacteroidia bacterium]
MSVFGSRNKGTNGEAAQQAGINIIGLGTTIEGNIDAQGDIRIDGKIVGNIVSKSKVVIGPTGFVEGNIIARNAEIAGETVGKVNVEELLTLKNTANVNGDITTSKLMVETGANFSGTCQMGAVVKELNGGNAETKVANVR